MSLLQPDSGLLFWMLLSFLIILALLAKYGFPVITKMVNQRKEYIDKSIAEAKKAAEKMERLKTESDTIIAQAYKQQQEIIKEGKAICEKMIADAKNDAYKEKQRVIDQTLEQIKAEKEKALSEIKASVLDISIRIAEQVLRKELESKQQQKEYSARLIDEILKSENRKS